MRYKLLKFLKWAYWRLHEHLYPVKWVLHGNRMYCPSCKGTDCLVRQESMLCSTHIQVNDDGSWDWTGDSDVHWDTSDWSREDYEAEWRCTHCDIEFDAPDLRIPYQLVKGDS
jgi:hypothetical protein